MPYRIAEHAGVLFFRWEVATLLADVQRGRQEVKARLEGGPKSAFVVVVDQDCKAPDSATREQLTELMGWSFPLFQHVSLVIEGSGLGAEVKRTFARALFALSGRKASLYPTVAQALREGARLSPAEVDDHNRALAAQAFPWS